MKIRLTLLTLIAGLMAFNANAQDNPPAGERPSRPGGPGGAPGSGRARFQPTDEEKKKYDKDGNGELSREEMRALFADRQKELEKKYDANGDGKLDDEERKKMETENPRRVPGGPGAPGGQPATAEEIKTHDKNGDGKLDDDEKIALREARQKARLEKYDTDKDGKLSAEEQQKMIEDIRKAGGGTGRPGAGRTGGRTRPNAGGDGEKKTDAAKIPVPGSAPAPESK
jgi:hypothetical protein